MHAVLHSLVRLIIAELRGADPKQLSLAVQPKTGLTARGTPAASMKVSQQRHSTDSLMAIQATLPVYGTVICRRTSSSACKCNKGRALSDRC